MLGISLTAGLISSCCFLTHFIAFQNFGVGFKRIRFLGVFGGVVADSTLFLIGILTSVGWAITIHKLPNPRNFLGLVAVIGGLTALLELHSDATLDESTKLYTYESPGGVFVLVLKMAMLCWFSFQMKSTYEEELHDKKRRYYKYFGMSVGVWMLHAPLTVILAFSVSPWYRFKVVFIADITSRFLGLLVVSVLLGGPFSPISQENSFNANSQELIGVHGFAGAGLY